MNGGIVKLNKRKRVWCLAALCLMFIGCGDLDKKEVTEEVTEVMEEAEESTVIDETASIEEGQQKSYDQAVKLYEKGDYEEAIDLFNSVIKFNDSKVMIKKCKYGLAVDYFEAEKYVEAFELFFEVGAYEDAKDLAVQCLSIVPDKIFDNAKSLLENGDAERALKHFRWINNNKYRVEYEFENLALCIACAYDMRSFSKTYYKNQLSEEKCIEIDGTDVYVYSSFPVIDKGNYKIVDYKYFNDGLITEAGFVLDNGIIVHYESELDGSIQVIDSVNQVEQSFISEEQAEFLVQQKNMEINKKKINQERKIRKVLRILGCLRMN